MNILGISAYYHDSAACLVQDGRIRSAAQEERFTRIKHDQRFPEHAIAWCLEDAGLAHGDIDLVAFYDKPFLKFERILQTHLQLRFETGDTSRKRRVASSTAEKHQRVIHLDRVVVEVFRPSL